VPWGVCRARGPQEFRGELLNGRDLESAELPMPLASQTAPAGPYCTRSWPGGSGWRRGADAVGTCRALAGDLMVAAGTCASTSAELGAGGVTARRGGGARLPRDRESKTRGSTPPALAVRHPRSPQTQKCRAIEGDGRQAQGGSMRFYRFRAEQRRSRGGAEAEAELRWVGARAGSRGPRGRDSFRGEFGARREVPPKLRGHPTAPVRPAPFSRALPTP
jgi:hypothetical protein